MTRFSKLTMGSDGILRETDIRDIPQDAMMKCPHCIISPEHYREDNTCRCNDPDHQEMDDWGYLWDAGLNQWITPKEDTP